MKENTKKYVKNTLEDLDFCINTLDDVYKDCLKDIRKAQRNLRKFYEKIICG